MRGRFALGFAVALACAALAALVWAGALVASWQHDCRAPGHTSSAVQKPLSLWPPGVKCLDTAGSKGAAAGHDTYVHQAVPFATTAITALAAFAGVALVAGIAAGIRDRRRRQPEPPPVPGVP